ncbi:MAG: glycosyltransferase family 4 protein [Verrucomicrobiales bacterium]|nr:glycosyltransferase family 4 protein [Verrucomicrobiales bacterium]
MRVLIVCNEYPPASHGGIGSATFDLACELLASGIDFELVGIIPPATFERFSLPVLDEQYGYPVHRLRTPVGSRLPFPVQVWADRRRLRRWIWRRHREKPFDLVFTDDYNGMLPWGPPPGSVLVVRLNGSNLVYDSLMQRDGQRRIWDCERRMLNRARRWIGVSRFFLDETRARIPAPAGTALSVLPNPVDTDLFSPGSADDISVPGRIVYHNTLHRRKGIYDLFAALPQVFATVPEAHLEIYGGKADLPKIQESLLGLLPAGDRGRVVFFGRVDRYSVLPGALEKARVACYPSHLETFGIAPIEAMAMQRVTIYSDCGPGREIVTPGVDGLLCEPKNPASIARCLIGALTLPDEARLAMGRAARHTAVSRFGKTVVCRGYLEQFRETLDA